jgi:hypothetical protein
VDSKVKQVLRALQPGTSSSPSHPLDEALECGQLGVAQQPPQVVVEDHALRRAARRVVERHLLRRRRQPLQQGSRRRSCAAAEWTTRKRCGIEVEQSHRTHNKLYLVR